MSWSATLRRACVGLSIALVSIAGTAAARAEYPERPIRLLVPSSPGGSADFVARLLGDHLTKRLGQTVVVENRGGGGGNIATEAVAKAAADGYTLLLTGNNHTLNVHLFEAPPYKLADFVPVIEATRGPSVLVASTDAPFSSAQALIEQARAKPGTIPYGSPGIGLPSHVAAALFERAAGIQLVHVPYRGSGPSLADAMGGQIPLVSSTLAAALGHVQGGRLRALAVTSAERWPQLPDTPSVQEVLGRPFEHMTWLGILAPAGTPPAVVEKLNTALNEVLRDPSVSEAIRSQGTQAQGGTAEAFGAMLQAESAESAKLVRDTGLTAH